MLAAFFCVFNVLEQDTTGWYYWN